ncbi:MAG: hypothetical protein IJ313_11710 [Clostridia bacterium]|nr:hypothetical protein [Clostridia bacterium]
MRRSEALRIRAIVEMAAASLDNKTASEAPALFRGLRRDGSLIQAGMRVNWNGTLKQAMVDLWDCEAHNPDNAPELWQDIAYRDGIRIIPQTITVADRFSRGEKGWWGDKLWESLTDDNVYTPEQWPDGWTAV